MMKEHEILSNIIAKQDEQYKNIIHKIDEIERIRASVQAADFYIMVDFKERIEKLEIQIKDFLPK